MTSARPPRTYWHLADLGRVPNDYDIGSSRLLYYPERGMGCRIEDLVHIRPDGTVEDLTPFPYDLEIEPRG